MTKGFWLVAGLTLLFATVLLSLQYQSRPIRDLSRMTPKTHPYYLACEHAHRLRKSSADDSVVAYHQARNLMETAYTSESHQALMDAMCACFLEGAFLDAGVDIGLLNGLLDAATRVDEFETVNPDLRSIRDLGGFGRLKLEVFSKNEELQLGVKTFVRGADRPLGIREFVLKATLGNSPSRSFRCKYPMRALNSAHLADLDALSFEREEPIGRFFRTEEIELQIHLQFRLVREDNTNIASLPALDRPIVLVPVVREGKLCYLPKRFAEDPEFELSVRALLEGMELPRGQKPYSSANERVLRL